MSDLLDLSGKIDSRSLALFATFSDVAGPLGVAFFLVGATARDMIFEFGHGLSSKRATLDRDFGVRISSWAEFEKLMESLLTSGLFKETNEVQRLLFQGELRVDILPFGGIAGAQGDIRWPEEHIDLVEVEDFDYVRAGARMLGRDLAKIAEPETMTRIKEILAEETAEEGRHGLIQDMMPVGSVFDKESGNRFDELLILLRQLVKGINDR